MHKNASSSSNVKPGTGTLYKLSKVQGFKDNFEFGSSLSINVQLSTEGPSLANMGDHAHPILHACAGKLRSQCAKSNLFPSFLLKFPVVSVVILPCCVCSHWRLFGLLIPLPALPMVDVYTPHDT